MLRLHTAYSRADLSNACQFPSVAPETAQNKFVVHTRYDATLQRTLPIHIGDAMKQQEILDMFREHASRMQNELPALNAVILELAQLLADSRGRLSKENFEALVRLGATLYREGDSRFHAKSEVDNIMRQSAKDHGRE